MIKTEYYRQRKDGVKLYKTYSDKDLMIQKEGTEEIYIEAIDVENSGFTYIETETPIPSEIRERELEEKAEAYDIIVGGIIE